MTQYDYDVEAVTGDVAALQTRLTALGLSGWQLVQVHSTGDAHRLFLIRLHPSGG